MTNNNTVYKVFMAWMPLAIVSIVLSGMVYLVAQQNYRQSANDPQIQIAEDIGNAIDQGTAATDIAGSLPQANMAQTLSPFVILYDTSHKELNTGVTLGTTTPTLPSGVLDSAKAKGEIHVTWQPAPGVREAIVVVAVDGGQKGYVLAGRSLQQIEIREQELTYEVGAGLLGALILSLLWAIFVAWMEMPKRPKSETAVVESPKEKIEEKKEDQAELPKP